MTHTIALVGSGEYLPEMASIEKELFEGRPLLYVQIPLAAGREGDARIAYWMRLGAEQARRIGATAVPIDLRDRKGTDDPKTIAKVKSAGIIYLSGGSPRHLVDSLIDTPLADALLEAYRAGTPLAGCSAGAMALGGWVPGLSRISPRAFPGLGIVPQVAVIPHFDRFMGRLGREISSLLLKPPDGVQVIGIEENTALIGRGSDWQVKGKGRVWLLSGPQPVAYEPGATPPLAPLE